MHGDSAGTHLIQALGRYVMTLADNPFQPGRAGADKLRRELKAGIRREMRVETLVSKLSAIAGDSREVDRERRALFHGKNPGDRFRRLLLDLHRLGREVERNAENVRILD